LTPREQQIAEMIIAGMSNNHIAGRLVLSVRTVETHIWNIAKKLSLHKRSEIAVWAARRNP
jgi:DNA-binding NarL/FixJ family response regulator